MKAPWTAIGSSTVAPRETSSLDVGTAAVFHPLGGVSLFGTISARACLYYGQVRKIPSSLRIPMGRTLALPEVHLSRTTGVPLCPPRHILPLTIKNTVEKENTTLFSLLDEKCPLRGSYSRKEQRLFSAPKVTQEVQTRLSLFHHQRWPVIRRGSPDPMSIWPSPLEGGTGISIGVVVIGNNLGDNP